MAKIGNKMCNHKYSSILSIAAVAVLVAYNQSIGSLSPQKKWRVGRCTRRKLRKGLDET